MTIAPAFLIICNSCAEGGTIPGFHAEQGRIRVELPPGWIEKSSKIQVAGQTPVITHVCPDCAQKAEKPTIIKP